MNELGRVDPRRVIADLRELDRRTGGEGGARRVCWTAEWKAARTFLRELLEPLPVAVEIDAAGNLWAELEGSGGGLVAVGSHLDSVPHGGWLDGALGVLAGVEVLRAVAASGVRPQAALALVDWAEEEGARFGRSLLGSSAFAGTLDPDAVRGLEDEDGIRLDRALAEHGLEVDLMPAAGQARRERLRAYLELHIEQGPVLEAEGLACGAVLGTFGVDRHLVEFAGRSSHAGSTPMEHRRDAGVAAARLVAALPEVAARHGGVCTAGRISCDPGVATVVPGRCEVLVDQRHLSAPALKAMVDEARRLWEASAEAQGCTVSTERIWAIEPVEFDERLVAAAAAACQEATGADRTLPSGALHDASELARLVPTAMVFSSSTGGVSHSPSEDTPEPDLEAAIAAFGRLALGVLREAGES